MTKRRDAVRTVVVDFSPQADLAYADFRKGIKIRSSRCSGRWADEPAVCSIGAVRIAKQFVHASVAANDSG
jgi:hypothetical protein